MTNVTPLCVLSFEKNDKEEKSSFYKFGISNIYLSYFFDKAFVIINILQYFPTKTPTED